MERALHGMARDFGEMMLLSSRAVSPFFAQLSEKSVQSVRSVNRGKCSLSGVTAENSSFQRVIGGEDEIFVQQGDRGAASS